MTKADLGKIKEEIESLREEINRYIQYPDIFKEELVESSQKIDILINEYLEFSRE
ncbi:MAG TPA: aspartyl-phosphate phosphatase Spo0E family protein [Peptostreptococcaceae bacterium]|nr:aspartyl-phosphate phosphatase Spo0E family protein [Peptostreptococcaceae bacterium]